MLFTDIRGERTTQIKEEPETTALRLAPCFTVLDDGYSMDYKLPAESGNYGQSESVVANFSYDRAIYDAVFAVTF